MKIAATLHELLTVNAAVRPDANEGILGVFQRGFTALLCRRPSLRRTRRAYRGTCHPTNVAATV